MKQVKRFPHENTQREKRRRPIMEASRTLRFKGKSEEKPTKKTKVKGEQGEESIKDARQERPKILINRWGLRWPIVSKAAE